MRPALRQQQRQEEAHARAHGRQALPVQTVRQVVHAPQLSEETHEGKRLALLYTAPLFKPHFSIQNSSVTYIVGR